MCNQAYAGIGELAATESLDVRSSYLQEHQADLHRENSCCASYRSWPCSCGLWHDIHSLSKGNTGCSGQCPASFSCRFENVYRLLRTAQIENRLLREPGLLFDCIEHPPVRLQWRANL